MLKKLTLALLFACLIQNAFSQVINCPAPLPSVISNVTVCKGNSKALSAKANGTGVLQWFNGNDIATANKLNIPSSEYIPYDTAIGTYSYYVAEYNSDNACYGPLAEVNYTINPIPQLTISATKKVISEHDSSILTVTGANTYIWNTNEKTDTIIVKPMVTSVYTVTGVLNGCLSKKIFPIIVSYECTPLNHKELPYAISVSKLTLCNGESTMLYAPLVHPVLQDQKFDFLWYYGDDLVCIKTTLNANFASVYTDSCLVTFANPGRYTLIVRDHDHPTRTNCHQQSSVLMYSLVDQNAYKLDSTITIFMGDSTNVDGTFHFNADTIVKKFSMKCGCDSSITYKIQVLIVGDINKNGLIDNGEIAGDVNDNGIIDNSEIAGDVNGNGIIDELETGKKAYVQFEIAGDVNGNGIIDNDELAGDINGNKQIDLNELLGDINGDKQIAGTELLGDKNGNEIIDSNELTGINVLDLTTIKISPIPAKRFLYINGTNSTIIDAVQIVSSNGKTVYENRDLHKTSLVIPLREFVSGVYNVILWVDGKRKTQEIIIE